MHMYVYYLFMCRDVPKALAVNECRFAQRYDAEKKGARIISIHIISFYPSIVFNLPYLYIIGC